MDKLTPSAQRTLDALQTGPGNVHELAERTGRSRSTTDKALNDLAKVGLISKANDSGDPADGAPTRWRLADPASAAGDTTESEVTDDGPTSQDTDGEANAAVSDEPTNPPADPDNSAGQTAEPQPSDDEPTLTHAQSGTAPEAEAQPASRPASDGDDAGQEHATSDVDGMPHEEANAAGDGPQTEPEPPKLCRGCQDQMPKICECCWQKTPAYCGKCRRTMPQIHRGEPGEPVILSNGLVKLRPGELETMVEKVMREQPLPAFQGIIGWTGGRLAIHIPGRSPGAMTNAMRKFTKEGKAELIGDDPERYKLTGTGQVDEPAGSDANNGTDAEDNGKDPAIPTDTARPADAAEPNRDHVA